MRILSWNINGIKTIPQYHPWNTLKTADAILKHLDADIICFQEMKSSRSTLERKLALPDSYDAFFSFPKSRGGYSGVGVYTSHAAAALKAEEGLCGTISNLKPPLSEEESIKGYPTAEDLHEVLYPDEQGDKPEDLTLLDSEGRALTLDFGIFMNYHLMLEDRVRRLRAQGREVIVVGDINICAQPLDHCDGHLPSYRDAWYSHPARVWFRQWLHPEGPMIDIVRQFNPNREGMYTCWNTKIQARETNYGTRVDYILITPGLLPWVKGGNIQPSLKGSDHCPIYIDLHEEIVDVDGNIVRLSDKIGANIKSEERRLPPRLATRFWDEYSGKQKLLSSFFGKSRPKAEEDSSELPPPTNNVPSSDVYHPNPTKILDPSPSESKVPAPTPSKPVAVVHETGVKVAGLPPSQATMEIGPIEEPATQIQAAPDIERSTSKRRLSSDSIQIVSAPDPHASDAYNAVLRKPKRQKSTAVTKGASDPKGKGQPKTIGTQRKLSSFFDAPKTKDATVHSDSDVIIDITDVDATEEEASRCAEVVDEDADRRLALELSQQEESERTPLFLSQSSTQSSLTSSPAKSKAAWSSLFARVGPPRCVVHGEPAKQFTVNKPGPNKGRVFFVCSRPVGPGYDRGRGERLRTEVDHRYKCNFFMWSSDVRRGEPSTNVSAD